MTITHATDQRLWDEFLAARPYSPFLQSWTMGDVFADVGQEPIRLELQEDGRVTGVCLAIVVPARRGRHLAVQYGPVTENPSAIPRFIDALGDVAAEQRCSFIRMSPFLPATRTIESGSRRALPSPLHLLAEHIWYLPLRQENAWTGAQSADSVTEESLFMNLRKTTRNLIRRAEKEGVVIERSVNPIADVEHFITLHDETRKRHGFTPYSNSFFRAQVKHFTPRDEAIVYLARYQDEVIAASVHMQFGGETSYHHGASTHRFSKIPASYLLQWTAIRDAIARGDGIYSFWGIAPLSEEGDGRQVADKKHPFAGVTLFKTGFGGELLNLHHCIDVPLRPSYRFTRAFEYARKWKRGF